MFINLTSHRICFEDGRTIPSSGIIRCSEVIVPAGEHDDIPLIRRTFGAVENLPEPKEGVIYIVSILVRISHPERTDLASPGQLERDSFGNIICVKELVIN